MPILHEALDDESYRALDWIPLAGVAENRHSPWALATKFLDQSGILRREGNDKHADALLLLGGSISMHMRLSTHATFGPMIQMDQKRSMSMEDLGEHDGELLARAARDAPYPWLKARFADLSITINKRRPPDWKLGQLAAHAYLEYAESLFGTDNAIDGLDEICRGLILTRVYAKKDEELWKKYWSAILREIPHSIKRNWPGIVFCFCDEAISRSSEACSEIVPQIEAKAAELTSNEPQSAADWYRYAYRIRSRLKQHQEAASALVAQGEAMVRAAEWSAEHTPLLAPMQLSEAINILRRAKSDPSRIRDLRDRLAQYEHASLDHYGTTEHQVDVTDLVQCIEKQIAAEDLITALLSMAYRTTNLLDFEEIRKRVHQDAKAHPLTHSFGSSHTNNDGAIILKRDPFNENDPSSVMQHMVKSATHDITMRGSLLAARSADAIYSKHQPSFNSIKEIVIASPISVLAHSETISRGLFSGLIGDWIAASAYLIPNIEPFVREHLKRAGAHTASIDEGGVQRERTLGELLDMQEAEETLGRNLVFELQVHMSHQDGFNLRNLYCHGLIDDSELQNSATMSLWWLIWRVTLLPWHNQITHKQDHERDFP